jgi:hypothetical protein
MDADHDNLLRIAEQMAAEQSMPVDKVVSGLIRKGLENTRPILTEGAHGFPDFRAPTGRQGGNA